MRHSGLLIGIVIIGYIIANMYIIISPWVIAGIIILAIVTWLIELEDKQKIEKDNENIEK